MTPYDEEAPCGDGGDGDGGSRRVALPVVLGLRRTLRCRTGRVLAVHVCTSKTGIWGAYVKRFDAGHSWQLQRGALGSGWPMTISGDL